MRIKDPINIPIAAGLVGLTPENFRRYILRGETPPYIKIGRWCIFERQDILDWEKPHKVQGLTNKRRGHVKKSSINRGKKA